ncbi:MAG TPA: class II aldolase/adducin family protein [Stellaceae bacterium]|nr:class II aldolase/adducin family protein [Stellaceae bacterium]
MTAAAPRETAWPSPEEAALRHKTATMCRMLALQGLIGMFGHVSIRVPGTNRVLLTPGAGSDKLSIRAEDIFVFDLGGEILHHPGTDKPHEIPLEWRIHTQIHRDRPEAMCVAHLHARHAVLLGIAGRAIVPVFQHGAFLKSGVPTWNNPRLVVRDEQAASLSQALGGSIAAQMRGHGVVVAAKSAEIAFFACTFLEENARKQYEAQAFGGAVPLTEAEAEDCAKGSLNDRLFRLLWEYYARKADAGTQIAGPPAL